MNMCSSLRDKIYLRYIIGIEGRPHLIMTAMQYFASDKVDLWFQKSIAGKADASHRFFDLTDAIADNLKK